MTNKPKNPSTNNGPVFERRVGETWQPVGKISPVWLDPMGEKLVPTSPDAAIKVPGVVFDGEPAFFGLKRLITRPEEEFVVRARLPESPDETLPILEIIPVQIPAEEIQVFSHPPLSLADNPYLKK